MLHICSIEDIDNIRAGGLKCACLTHSCLRRDGGASDRRRRAKERITMASSVCVIPLTAMVGPCRPGTPPWSWTRLWESIGPLAMPQAKQFGRSCATWQ